VTDGDRSAWNEWPQLPVRLDKFLREAAGLTRREVNRAWDDARIEASVDHPAGLVFPGDSVRLDGELLERKLPTTYIALNKPAGVLTARRDPHGRACLEPWIGEWDTAVFPVGRLDRATTGLLLLTDDGDLAHMLMHPRFHVDKTYLATLARWHDAHEVDVEQFTRGLELQDGPAVATHAAIHETCPRVVLRIEVDEGRNHLVRNMVRVAGYALDALHRTRIGSLELGDLGDGEVRRLSAHEVSDLWSSVGGRKRVWRRRLAALERRADSWRSQGEPHERLETFLHVLDVHRGPKRTTAKTDDER
jgi:23S rRNA pseudouridine2605 synthase